MTSFRVNYYLSGLHSYAKGDPVPVPQWVYWVVGALAAVSMLAVLRYRAFSAKEKSLLEGKTPARSTPAQQEGNNQPQRELPNDTRSHQGLVLLLLWENGRV